MTLSDLIDDLNTLFFRHGDIDVRVARNYDDWEIDEAYADCDSRDKYTAFIEAKL